MVLGGGLLFPRTKVCGFAFLGNVLDIYLRISKYKPFFFVISLESSSTRPPSSLDNLHYPDVRPHDPRAVTMGRVDAPPP